MTDIIAAKNDARPARGGWAPGNYFNRCIRCEARFIGDKRAIWCADCAYAVEVQGRALPLPEGEPAELVKRGRELHAKVALWPERRDDDINDLLELRNAVPEMLATLSRQAASLAASEARADLCAAGVEEAQAAIFEARSRAEAAEASLASLQDRLEMRHAWQSKAGGPLERIEVEPGSIPDGISCRDETIKLQGERIAKLAASLATVERDRDEWKQLAFDRTDELLAIEKRAEASLASARREALEEAAKVCDARGQWAESKIVDDKDSGGFGNYANACDDCAECVRDLLSSPRQEDTPT